MALARARRSESGFNYWPGFVDALSTLVLSIVFLLSVFLVVQFFLSQEVTGKDKALEQLNAKIAQLNDLLSLEKLAKLNLDDQVSQLRAGLSSAEGERPRAQVEFQLGESVKVTSGPLADFDGEIVDINPDQQKLKVLVDIFERQVPVELGFDQVKKLD